ncbi:MAG: dTDP-4-dehydrorhamnose reductase [Xanthobacteraceae bacterium]
MILVFGGNGQLGQELIRAAAVRATVLRALSHAEADIADASAIATALALWKPNLVVNAAAYTKVDLAETELEEARRGNEIGPAVLAAACARAGVPMVHISTDYVFDGSKEGAYLESDPACPISAYGRSKAAGEEAVRSHLAQHVILRTAWVYSEFGHNFLKTVLRLAATRDELRIVSDQHGSPTSAGELAEAVLNVAAAFVHDRTLAGTYHFTAAGVTTWHGFASRIVAIAAPVTGRNPRVIPIGTADYPTPAKRPANSRLDCRSFVKTFGFLPRHWTVGVDATTRALVDSVQQAGSHVA